MACIHLKMCKCAFCHDGVWLWTHPGHLKETDVAPPYRYGEYFYYTRTEEGKSYTIYCRKKCTRSADGDVTLSPDTPEEVYLDVNVIGVDKNHCDIRSVRCIAESTRMDAVKMI